MDSKESTYRILIQVAIWFITTIFIGGVVYGTMATKSYVDERDAILLDKIEKRLEKIENNIYENQKIIYNELIKLNNLIGANKNRAGDK